LKVVPLDRLDHVPAEEDELADLIDQLHRDDPELQRLRRRILRLQRQLRARVDDDTWRVYLRLEETVNERSSLLITKLVARRSELRKS
jgi:predicted  nucleic acid-binding Zn-ribbon protein